MTDTGSETAVTGWTEARVETLKRLFAEGLSASQIAAELGGVSRSAVIGKAHRIGLTGWRKVSGTAKPRRARVRPPRPAVRFPDIELTQIGARAPAAPPRSPCPRVAESRETPCPVPRAGVEAAPDPAADPDAGTGPGETAAGTPAAGIGLLDLTARTCRWPHGDPRDDGFGYCGAAKPAGAPIDAPYCARHAALAYESESERRRRARLAAKSARAVDAENAAKRLRGGRP